MFKILFMFFFHHGTRQTHLNRTILTGTYSISQEKDHTKYTQHSVHLFWSKVQWCCWWSSETVSFCIASLGAIRGCFDDVLLTYNALYIWSIYRRIGPINSNYNDVFQFYQIRKPQLFKIILWFWNEFVLLISPSNLNKTKYGNICFIFHTK